MVLALSEDLLLSLQLWQLREPFFVLLPRIRVFHICCVAIHNISTIINSYVRASKYLYVTVGTVRTGDYHNMNEKLDVRNETKLN